MSSNRYLELPKLDLVNFTSSGELSTDTSLSIYNRKVNPEYYKGLSFVLFYSNGCCYEYLNELNNINSKLPIYNKGKNIPISIFVYDTSKGTNNTIHSVLEHSAYRIMGFPYIVTFFDGNFCSIYKPDNLPEPKDLAVNLLEYSNKLTTSSYCNSIF